MHALISSDFSHVFGNEAVLNRLERLGRHTRIFPHLVSVGFPAGQLDSARQWFTQSAASPVEVYASQNMARGFFEDESLLQVFCRYFECTDWKLENSPWFFSGEDYQRFFAALLEPIEFQIRQLGQGLGEERWGRFFGKLPLELSLEQARAALWEDICRAEFYWAPGQTYGHLRAAALFGYLQRTLNILDVAPGRFNYQWERAFRESLGDALRRFDDKLAAAALIWAELRSQRNRQRRRRGGRVAPIALIGSTELLQAFTQLELEPETATPARLRRAFRRLSKLAHPDQGGSPEAFRSLSRSKALVEAWLARPGTG